MHLLSDFAMKEINLQIKEHLKKEKDKRLKEFWKGKTLDTQKRKEIMKTKYHEEWLKIRNEAISWLDHLETIEWSREISRFDEEEMNRKKWKEYWEKKNINWSQIMADKWLGHEKKEKMRLHETAMRRQAADAAVKVIIIRKDIPFVAQDAGP